MAEFAPLEKITWEESTVVTGWFKEGFVIERSHDELSQEEMVGRRIFEDDKSVVLVSVFSTLGNVYGYRRIPKRCIVKRVALEIVEGEPGEKQDA